MGAISDVASLLVDLRSRGVTLAAAGDKLRIDAPRGTMTKELLATLAEHKREIIAALVEGKRIGYGMCPGPDRCGGCYSIGMIDGRERFLHPPKG